MESYQLRKVLEVLGHSVNLKQADLILEGFSQNYTSRVLIQDFENQYLCGFPLVKYTTRLFNGFKKRIDGFIFAGRNTFYEIMNDLKES